MCRLLGFWSTTPRTFPEVMGRDWEVFVDLSRKHPDGWGLAWVDGDGRTNLTKAPKAAFQSSDFWRVTEEMQSRAAILHFRWASPGLDITFSNTHPFLSHDRSVAFMHNGAVHPPERVWEAVPHDIAGRQEHGTTDSEAYFRLWESSFERGRPPVEAIREVIGRFRSRPYRYTGLNAMLLHPRASYVVAEYQPTAPLAMEDPDYYKLYVSRQPDLLVAASSQWSIPASWQLLPNHSVLTVSAAPEIDGEIVALTESC